MSRASRTLSVTFGVCRPFHMFLASFMLHCSVFWQTTRIGVVYTLSAVLPSCPLQRVT